MLIVDNAGAYDPQDPSDAAMRSFHGVMNERELRQMKDRLLNRSA